MNTSNRQPANQTGCRSCLTIVGGSAGIGFLILAGIVFAYFVLWGLGAILIVGDPLQKADVAVLLSGGDIGRAKAAAKMYQDGLVHNVVVTETGELIEGSSTRYSALVRNQVAANGVPMDSIWTTRGQATSTFQEAQDVLALLQLFDLKKVIVVTDPYHTLRTRLIFRDAFRGSDMKVIVHPSGEHWYRSATWMFHREGWRITVREYIKLFAYLAGVYQ